MQSYFKPEVNCGIKINKSQYVVVCVYNICVPAHLHQVYKKKLRRPPAGLGLE